MRFLLGDNHRIFGDLLRHYMIRRIPLAEMQAASSHDEFLALARDQEFDLVAFNLHMPGAGVPATIDALHERLPGTPIAVFADASDLSQAIACIKSGAMGFIPKTMGADDVLEALAKVLAGDEFLPDFVMLEDGAEDKPNGADKSGILGQQMTRREFAVLQELCGGKSNKEIGRGLGIAEQTVKIHLQRIFKKIGAKNRADAVRIALHPPATE